jgi:hypothetical protein
MAQLFNKYVTYIPLCISLPTLTWTYKRRNENMSHPVMERAIASLKNDKRVIDFCGDDIKPGWIITKS